MVECDRKERDMPDLIDVSVPLRPEIPVWPGDAPFRITRVSDMGRGDHNNLSEMCLGTHTGTHVDAPAHFLAGGATIDTLPPDALVGRCRVLGIDANEAIGVADLEAHGIAEGERVLLKTRNSALWGSDAFAEDFVHLSTEAAEWLAARKPRCLGVDYLSVGGFHKNGTPVHRALLGAGIWLIEGLDLRRAEPGEYELLCLPLRVAGAEGSPARALLRTLG
jgi:arylformamidase